MSEITKTVFTEETLAYLLASVNNKQLIDAVGQQKAEEKCEALLQNLSRPPLFTTLRVNTLRTDVEAAAQHLQEEVNKQYSAKKLDPPKVSVHPDLPDTLVLPNTGPRPLTKHVHEVIVDLSCGMAVLRGADVFVQGIMAAPQGLNVDDQVSVYCDIDGQCRKGLTKPFEGTKMHVGNGVAKVSRHQLFVTQEKTQGIGVLLTDPLYAAPCLSDILPDVLFAQNLPSVVCSHVLDTQPGEMVLDMCAAPGGKTCHIATLMKNTGQVVAFDKSKRKVERIMNNSHTWGLTKIEAYVQDGRKAVQETEAASGLPPYPPSSFDRVMLDAPCSALGQRPCAKNKMTLSEVKSFPALQRKLFEKAVVLLKAGGTLVYSTCSIPLEENEALVAWALHNHPCLQLQKQVPHLGRFGWHGSDLTEEQRQLIQRFDPSIITDDTGKNTVETDTIGFFIAKFLKKDDIKT